MTDIQEEWRNRARLRAITASVIAGATIMAVKFYAYWITGSAAILSDAFESIINVAASTFALASILIAKRPPDRGHPYGHGKIEYFSVGFEGALIVLAALGIFFTGVKQVLAPQTIPQIHAGLLLLAGAGVANLVLGSVLVRVGRQTQSVSLVGDGRHVLADVYTSGGVLLGLLAVHLTGRMWLDGVVACLMGGYVMVSGMRLLRRSFAGLMDASDPELMEKISTHLARHRKENWIDIHRLRAWVSGDLVHVDLHLILPRDLSLEQAHAQVKELEELIKAHFSGKAGVLIHADPCLDSHCPICPRGECSLRAQEQTESVPWNSENLVLEDRFD